MKHALIAASLVLVAGLGAGCGGGDDQEPKTSQTSASATEEFCKAYNSLGEEFEAGAQPKQKEVVQALKRWADELEQTGPPESMPPEARDGYELIVETVQKIEDDATQADIQKLTEAFSKAERVSSNEFGQWVQKTCPREAPSGSPSEDSSSSAP